MESESSPIPPDALLRHDAFLRGLARALAGDRGEGDDLVQETWLAALRRRPDDAQSLRPWLASSLRGIAASGRRRFARRVATERRGARSEEVPLEPSSAELLERQQVVTNAVLKLDEPYRTCVLLHYYREVPLREIARIEDVPLETVRTRLKRGLARLREELDRAHGGDRETWAAALRPERTTAHRLPLWPLAIALALSVAIAGFLAFKRDRVDDVESAWTRDHLPAAGTSVLREDSVHAALKLDRFEMIAIPGSQAWNPPVELDLRVAFSIRTRTDVPGSGAEASNGPREMTLACQKVDASTDVFAVLAVGAERREQTQAIGATSPSEGRVHTVPIERDRLAALLPDRRFAAGGRVAAGEHFVPGAEWTIPAPSFARLLTPDAGIELVSRESEPPLVLGAGFWKPSEWLGDSAQGEVCVRLVESNAAGQSSRAVLTVIADVSDERDLLEIERMRIVTPEMRRETFRARTHVHGAGELVWDLERDSAVSFRFIGDITLALDETRVLISPKGEFRLHSDVNLSGTLESRVDFHSIDDASKGQSK